MLARVGATRSMKLYCHEAVGAEALKGLGIAALSLMPWFAAQVMRMTLVFGWGNRKTKFVPVPVAFVAATPLISKSDAPTLVTGLEKTTVIWVRLLTEAPAGGVCERTTGGTKSRNVYCQLVPGSNAFGGCSRSVIPAFGASATFTPPNGGWGKVKILTAPSPEMPLAGAPFTIRSEASTPVTGSLHVRVICDRLLTVAPAVGLRNASTGALALMRE